MNCERNHHSALASALAGVLACMALCHHAGAAAPEKAAQGQLNGILVSAQRERDAAADRALEQTTAAALHASPYFYDAHVSITVSNGVATLHGIVFDDWDLRIALRLARKAPGIRRVVNDLEIKLGGE